MQNMFSQQLNNMQQNIQQTIQQSVSSQVANALNNYQFPSQPGAVQAPATNPIPPSNNPYASLDGSNQ